MCGVKVKGGIPCGELRETLGLDDMVSVLQQNRLRWCGHVLHGGGGGWVKNCMEYEVEGAGLGGGPKKTWAEVVQKDC